MMTQGGYRSNVSLIFVCLAVVPGLWMSAVTFAETTSDELSKWIDQRASQAYGPIPESCDDWTFARRIYLDSLGRIPSLAELQDYQSYSVHRRDELIGQLVFGRGERGAIHKKLNSAHLARLWRRVLVPAGSTVNGSPEAIESWLTESFANEKPLDEMMRELVRATPNTSAAAYYNLVGAQPQNYAGHISRVLFGVRIECSQCHDHPFAPWKQSDFWGLAAFYSDMNQAGDDNSVKSAGLGTIVNEGVTYHSKYLWDLDGSNPSRDVPISGVAVGNELRSKLAKWATDPNNPHFSATMVNRIWQQLVGRGIYSDVENLDMAKPNERAFLDEFGNKFEEIRFDIRVLMAAIFKSRWYQAKSYAPGEAGGSDAFARSLKVISPEQIFDSFEQSLHLPVSRIDPSASRWTADRVQFVSRLSETAGATPEDYASGIPQALLLMNGKMTGEAIDWNRSRMLRAVVDAPFLDDASRLDSLFLCVLTREPSAEEREALTAFLRKQTDEASKRRAYGEILWALLNSPEFVLCR